MIVSLGLDASSVSVAIREKFHRLGTPEGSFQPTRSQHVREIASLRTCNRVELYGWSDLDGDAVAADAAEEMATRWIVDHTDRTAFLAFGRLRVGRDAVEHLLRVSSGLESQVIGDIHVLGQIRRAYREAQEHGSLGPYLHRLFETAIQTGKRVKRETELMAGRSSVGSEAAAHVLRTLGEGRRLRAVVVGCGKVGTHAARTLARSGRAQLTLINRSEERSRALAQELGCRWAPWRRLHAEVAQAQGVVVATGAPDPVVRREALARARGDAAGSVVLVDVAMPRNVDPEVSRLAAVQLADLDDIRPELVQLERARRAAMPAAVRIVLEESYGYVRWLGVQEAVSALEPLRALLLDVCQREVEFVAGSETGRRTAERIVAKVLARPLSSVRDGRTDPDAVGPMADALHTLFSLPGAQERALAARAD